jgi:hypothetical protein
VYWRPLYFFVRQQGGYTPEDAQDLTQEFIARWLEKDYLKAAAKEKGRFRITKRRCHCLQTVHALKHRPQLSKGLSCIVRKNEDVRLAAPDIVPINIGRIPQSCGQTVLHRDHLVVVCQ